jgi:glycolate oxidase FAD binding subunit
MAVSAERKRFAIGDRAPKRVAEPATIEALASALRDADERGEAVVLFGGGTLQGIGAPPERYDVALSLCAIAGIAAYEPHDLTVCALAGTRLDELARTLEANGQFVPIDAPRPASGTVGGALAAGWLGPRRQTYGRARDLVIGSTAVLADGTIAKAGGMVVKNVSGYDMSKLYIGSLGTLGALASVNFKTLPMPEVHRAAIARLPERTRGHAIANVRALAIEPTAALAVRGFAAEIDGRDAIDGRLVLLFEGSGAAVERATRDLRSALGAAGVPETTIVDAGALDILQRVVDAYTAAVRGRSVTYRFFGLPAEVESLAANIERLARTHALTCETICDLRSGDLVARLSGGNASVLETRVIPFDDELHDQPRRVTVIDAPSSLRAKLNAWGEPPAALATMRELKARFDPRGTLAPGRFVGGI